MYMMFFGNTCLSATESNSTYRLDDAYICTHDVTLVLGLSIHVALVNRGDLGQDLFVDSTIIPFHTIRELLFSFIHFLNNFS
jgi:hypothetical protein